MGGQRIHTQAINQWLRRASITSYYPPKDIHRARHMTKTTPAVNTVYAHKKNDK